MSVKGAKIVGVSVSGQQPGSVSGPITNGTTVQNNSQRLKNDLMKLASDEIENFREYRTAGNKIFDGLSKMIKNYSSFKISRQLIAGSMGKNTCLGYNFEPDFDVILFVRDVTSVDNVVEEIYKNLKEKLPSECEKWTGCKYDSKMLEKAKKGLKLHFPIKLGDKNVKIDFDVRLAFDFHSNPDEQTKQALEMIKKCKKPNEDWYSYSSSLSEKTVQFVNKQPNFVRQVIRLAKLWDKAVKVRGPNTYISGRSSIMELVAIKAASEADNNILTAYRRFLEFMQTFNKIHVNFYDAKKHPPPLIYDSVNPYNNYAKAFTIAQFNDFQDRATSTLVALTEAETSQDYRAKLEKVMSFFAKRDPK